MLQTLAKISKSFLGKVSKKVIKMRKVLKGNMLTFVDMRDHRIVDNSGLRPGW